MNDLAGPEEEAVKGVIISRDEEFLPFIELKNILGGFPSEHPSLEVGEKEFFDPIEGFYFFGFFLALFRLLFFLGRNFDFVRGARSRESGQLPFEIVGISSPDHIVFEMLIIRPFITNDSHGVDEKDRFAGILDRLFELREVTNFS